MQASSTLAARGSYAAQIALVAAAYFVAARLSLPLAIPPGYATAVWPPSGIALAAVLLLGARAWPGVWLGAALANLAVEASLPSALMIASGNTLEALVAGALIGRFAGDPGRFRRGEDVIKFVVLCAVAAGVAASMALIPLASGHSLTLSEGIRNWWTWWQGDVAGMIIVGPLILSWAARGGAQASPAKRGELACFGLLLLGVTIVLASDDATQFAPFSLTFVALPFMIWGAFRFGQREVASAVAAACAFAVWHVLERHELFALVPQNELLLMLLGFFSMVVTTGLVLAAVVGERRRTTEELRIRCHSLEAEAQQHARHDPLTGLANGMLFRERLAQLLAMSGADGTKVAVALVDVERFKTFNDTLGRKAGDQLLTHIAERMSHAQSGASVVARVGADCFAVAWSGLESESAAARTAGDSLERWFGAPYCMGVGEFSISARIGIALYPEDGSDPDVLFLRAESAVKRAKGIGERCVFYAREMSERVAGRLSLENRLRRAVDRREFVLHYQPKVDLDTRQVVGLEALIRWNSPDLGLVPPKQFIPHLEETGMILEVGRWAIGQAVLDQGLWAGIGVRVPRVAVNVSSIQLRQRDFVDLVERAIGRGGDSPLIDLEITESRIMEDSEANIEKLRRLRALGIGIAIDDFGTGYSSLAYLAKLPVQALKIDGSFIRRMLDDDEAMALVQTIISLARSLKLTTIAEGVESEAQADVLELLRCDQMQGFLISKPQPAQEVVALLMR